MDPSQIPAFLINLDRSPERLALATTALRQAGIEPVRFPAYDGSGLDAGTLVDCDLPAALSTMGRPLRGGEYGCYRSHLACAARIVASGRECGLVFEDDVEVSKDLPAAVEDIRAFLRARDIDWHVVNLGAPKLKLSTHMHQIAGGHRLVAAHYFPIACSGLLWSREGAARFVADHSTVRMPVDNLLQQVMTRSGKGYAVWPPLVRQVGLPSQIDEGAVSRKVAQRRWDYWYCQKRRLVSNSVVAGLRKVAFRRP